MKAKVYVFRVFIGFLALGLGIGIYWIVNYFQPPAEVEAICVLESEVKDVRNFAAIDIKYEPPIKEVTHVETENEFYPDGEFYPQDKLPKELRNLEIIAVSANDWTNASAENSHKPTAISPTGYLLEKKRFAFKRININNRLLNFETETIDGISYEFSGKYAKPQTNTDEYLHDLSGVITKFKDGKRIAKVKVLLYTGGC